MLIRGVTLTKMHMGELFSEVSVECTFWGLPQMSKTVHRRDDCMCTRVSETYSMKIRIFIFIYSYVLCFCGYNAFSVLCVRKKVYGQCQVVN
jgi:hypothetical protein